MSDWSEAFQALAMSARVSLGATLLATAVGVPLAFARASSERRHRVALAWPVVEIRSAAWAGVAADGGGVSADLRDWSEGAARAGVFTAVTEPGAVLAAAIVALPLIYLPSKSAFLAIDKDLHDAARLHGVVGRHLFVGVALPLAKRGIAAGVALGLARAMGEFGATLMVLGMQPDRMTLPLVLWSHYETGQYGRAVPAVVLLTAGALTLIVCFNWMNREDA